MATTIWIKEETKKLLDKVGRKGETYDSIIRRLIYGIPINMNKKWYRQGVQAVPYFIYIPVSKVIERVGDGFGFNIGINNYDYWDYKNAVSEAKKIIFKHIEEGNYIDKLVKKWRDIIDEQILYEKKISHNMKRPYDILKYMINTIKKSWDIAITIELFDADPEGIIEAILNKYDKKNMSIKEFMELCSNRLSIIKKEEIDFYNACKNGKLEDHQKKYFWIRNSWASTKYLDLNYFIERKKRLISEGFDFNVKNETKKIKINKNNKVGRAIDFFLKLGEWREKRKKTSMITNYYMEVLLENFMREYKINKKIALFALPDEYLNRKIRKKELIERSKIHVYYNNNFIVDEKARIFIDELRKSERTDNIRLYGTIANPGKVEGKAKIIFSMKDIKKVRKGDILVAPATRPEYLSAMKKAKAIITDEGGITSHASIVSRELKIPCIVGLYNATDVIKDNDLIFVNANHGIVEKR